MNVSMKGIVKSFGANDVLRQVDFSVRGGEICALLGENGAGKSTLMNILGGVIRPDQGQILLDGKPVSFRCDLTADGEEPWTCTGDVTLDESGLIAWIGNVVVNGEMSSATATIERAKIDNPLPNAYEGWRSFDITGLIIPE